MRKKVSFLFVFGLFGFGAFAQQTEKAALTATAPAFGSDSVQAIVKTEKPAVQPLVKKSSFSLSAGTMFGGNGMTTYLAPSMRYQLSPKFSVFGGVMYLNSSFTPYHSENKTPIASKNYFAYAGGSYDVSEKLRLSGSVWRDFSNSSSRLQPNNYSLPTRYGTSFSAQYKFSEHFSVTGSIRTSNGYSPYMNYGPDFGNTGFNNSGF